MIKDIILNFELFGFYIKVTSSDSLIQDLFNTIYSNIINNIDAASKAQLKHRDIIINRDNNIFHISNDMGDYNVDECEIVDFIIDIVNNSFDLFPQNKYVFFHGSAVSDENNCILFIAPTMQGKTTLCTQMVMNGYTYLSDDLIIMDQDCKIYPFPMPIKMRKNNIAHNADFEKYFTKINNAENKVLICKKESCLNKSFLLKPNKVFILERKENDDRFVAQKSSPFNSLNMLICNGAYIDNVQNHVWVAKKMSENMEVFKIIYNDYTQILDYLNNIDEVNAQ